MSDTKDVRLGVVGYGARGRSLFRTGGNLPRVTLAAVCDLNPAVADQAMQDAPGARFFRKYDEMLDSGLVSAVLVETSPDFHASCSVAALTRGIHVLSDVPAVHAIPEAETLYEAASASRAIYMFGENVNYWAFVDTCVELKAKGALGDPVYMEAEYVHDLGTLVEQTPWRRSYEPIRYCTHSLGPLMRWVDEDLKWVACFDTGNHVHPGRQEHDAMVAIFRTPGNVVVKVLCTFNNRHPYCFHRFVYYGTMGFFERTAPSVGKKAEVLFSSMADPAAKELVSLPVGIARPGLQVAGGHGGADYLMVKDFVEAIQQGRPAPIDVRQGLRMTVPGLYALESARRGGALTEIRYPWEK